MTFMRKSKDKGINLSKGHTGPGSAGSGGYTGYTGPTGYTGTVGRIGPNPSSYTGSTGYTGNNTYKTSISYSEKNKEIVENYEQAARALPLECCGLIVHIEIGVQGLSTQQIEEHVVEFISNYKDEGEISKHVKFYKEYYTVNQYTNNVVIKTIVI